MLHLLSIIFRFFVFVKNYAYNKSFIKSKKLPVPVISIGNLSVGGTGKTPMVAYLIQFFLNKKKKVSVLSRSYKRQSKNLQILNKKSVASPFFFGDEAFMIHKKYGVDYGIFSNRYLAGLKILQKSCVDYFILDDGFQHRKLFKDLDIVLIDASKDFKFYQYLPKGRLREGFLSLKRADIILFTKTNLVSQSHLNKLKNHINRSICLDNILTCDVHYCLLDKIQNIKNINLDKNQSVVLLSGIASPQNFENNILDKNIIIKKHFIFKDHHPYTQKEVDNIINYCFENNIKQIVCTEKDWYKLITFIQLKDILFYSQIDVHFLNKEQDFIKKIENL